MKHFRIGLPCVLILLSSAFCAALFAAETAPVPQHRKVRVLAVVGGHGFDTNEFCRVFRDNRDITFQIAEHPAAHALWKAGPANDWDVLVLYDLWQNITDESKADLLARLEEGKGLVVMHHAIANYQSWPEYAKIIGAKYYLAPARVDGTDKPRSQFKHDVRHTVRPSSAKHPVIRGIKPFEILDETYRLFDVHPDVTVLLTSEEPSSHSTLAWAKYYGRARVVYLQLGHDRFAYANPGFRRILAQSIRWTAHGK